MDSRPFCRKCLMEGVSEETLTEKIKAYLEALPADQRTGGEQYQIRLSLCEACPNLENGLCRLCGCFVLYRAGKLASHCPDAAPKW